MPAAEFMSQPSIRRCNDADFNTVLDIINDGAQAYRGWVPADRLHHPYMPPEELQHEIDAGVQFWGYDPHNQLLAIMGLQDVKDVTLIRHAYVRSASQGQGIGGSLLRHLLANARAPVLIGTWADAVWAISFYERHGFHVVPPQEKDHLLRIYWNVPERQMETSVVLAQHGWPSQGQTS